MDESEYMKSVEGGLIDRAAATPTDADKAALERLDIADPSGAEDDDAGEPHVEEEAEVALPEGGEDAMEEAQRYGFSPDEARILAANGLVTRIRSMRESIESKGKGTEQGQEAKATEQAVPDGTDPSDASLVETVKALQRELQEVKARFGRVPDAIDDHIIASGRGSLFGDGRYVDPDSQHAENRTLVRDTVETLEAGLRAKGKAVPPVAELVRRAMAMNFGDAPKDARQAAVSKRQQSFTARPSSVREPELPLGEDRARASVGAKLRSYGFKG